MGNNKRVSEKEFNKKKRFCACGCGGEIIWKPYMKYQGVPKYIQGHNQ